MDYKITSANAETGQIQVTYYNLGEVLATFPIDVPIVDGSYITGEQLEAEIQARAPNWLIERKEAAKIATGFETILAKVEPLPTQIGIAAIPSPFISRTTSGTTINDTPIFTVI